MGRWMPLLHFLHFTGNYPLPIHAKQFQYVCNTIWPQVYRQTGSALLLTLSTFAITNISFYKHTDVNFPHIRNCKFHK